MEPSVDKQDWNSVEDNVAKSAAVNESGDAACILAHVKLVVCLLVLIEENMVLAKIDLKLLYADRKASSSPTPILLDLIKSLFGFLLLLNDVDITLP